MRHDLPFGACPHHTDRRGWRGCQTAFLSPQHHTPLVSWQMLCSEHLKQHSTPQWHFYLHSIILLWCLDKCCVQNTWNNTTHHSDISISTVLYSSAVFTNAVFKTPETTQSITVTSLCPQHHTPLLYWQTCSKHLNETGRTQQQDNWIMIMYKSWQYIDK